MNHHHALPNPPRSRQASTCGFKHVCAQCVLCVHACLCVDVCTCAHLCVRPWALYIHVYLCVDVCMCVHLCVCSVLCIREYLRVDVRVRVHPMCARPVCLCACILCVAGAEREGEPGLNALQLCGPSMQLASDGVRA